jgi:hypothetical protein
LKIRIIWIMKQIILNLKRWDVKNQRYYFWLYLFWSTNISPRANLHRYKFIIFWMFIFLNISWCANLHRYKFIIFLMFIFSITNNETKTIIPSESNEHIASHKISKQSKCRINYKTITQFILMFIQLIFEILILYKEY